MSTFFQQMGWERPSWEIYLEQASETTIEETGLSREKLKEVLEVLHNHRVIN